MNLVRAKKKLRANDKISKGNGKRLRKIMGVLVKQELNKGLTPKKLRLIIEGLGPTFIKVGQMLSMRQDILPKEYCVELQKLRTQVTPMAFHTVLEVIKSEYQKSLDTIFYKIDKKPLGSASIAQVHAAILKNGEKVVIKVQRPGIYKIMAQDVSLLHKAIRLLNGVSRMSNVVDFKMIIDEMWSIAQKEMDFLNEAQNALDFYALNKEIKYVTCPLIYDEFTTRRVLVMEKIEGIEIDNADQLNLAGYDMKEIGNKLSENYIKQIIDDGFFQADPHSGNMLIRNGQIVWIDLGMMGRLSKRDMMIFKQSIMAVAIHDIEALKTAVLSLGIHKGVRINHSYLYDDIEVMVEEYGSQDLEQLNMGEFMEGMIDIASEHHISMPRGISMLSRGIMTIEGLIAEISPETSIIQIMTTHIASQNEKELDFKNFIQTNSQKLVLSGKKAIEIPGQLSDFLRLSNKGQLKVNLEIMGSEEPLAEVDKMVNKIVICIINAALLIGSSFIATTDMTPKLLGIPALGTIGYIGSIILGGRLIYTISKKKKYR